MMHASRTNLFSRATLATAALFLASVLHAQTTPLPLVTAQGSSGLVVEPGRTSTLSVQVTNRAGAPQPNVDVIFTGPAEGAGGSFAGADTAAPNYLTVRTGSNGIATASFTTNAIAGVFPVAAWVKDTVAGATFAFASLVQPPVPTLAAAAARNAVRSEILRNAVEDENLQLHGPFLIPAGAEVFPAGRSAYPDYIPSIVAQRTSWLFWIDDVPQALFSHATRFVLVDATQANASQAARQALVAPENWWPQVLLAASQTVHSLARPSPPGPLIAFSEEEEASSAAKPPALPPRFADPPDDACAIILSGPELQGSGHDVNRFLRHVLDNMLVKTKNIIWKFMRLSKTEVQAVPVSAEDIKILIKKAVDKKCKKVYIMFSGHGDSSESLGGDGLLLVHSVTTYEALVKLLEPLKQIEGLQLCIFQHSCFSGQFTAWLQGRGFTGEIVTSADDMHTAYANDKGSYFFQDFFPLIAGGKATSKDAVDMVKRNSKDPYVTVPNPQYSVINPTGVREMRIPAVRLPDKNNKVKVTLERPADVADGATFVVMVRGPGAIGTIGPQTVTLNPGQKSVQLEAVSTDCGIADWSVTAVDQATGQTYKGMNMYRVGYFRFQTSPLQIPQGDMLDQTVIRYGYGIDRGDVLLPGRPLTYEITSKDPTIAAPDKAEIEVASGVKDFKVPVKGIKQGKTTITVKLKGSTTQKEFPVEVLMPRLGAAGCPNQALWDTLAMVDQNLGNHPINPASGRWQFNSMGTTFTMQGPNSIQVGGMMNPMTCEFSGRALYQVFNFLTTVEIMNGAFIGMPMGALPIPREASRFAGVRFDYRIGGDGGLPGGLPISFRAQGTLLCVFPPTVATRSFSASGGSDFVAIAADPPCSWTAASSAPWLSLAAVTGRGPGNLTYFVAPNPLTTTRTATLTVAGHTLTVNQDAGGPNRPVIRTAGVVNGGSFNSGFTSGAWVTIQGQNLATTTRLWQSSDFQGDRLPTQLDGVGVTFNGKPAYIYYVSPGQLNVLAPPDTLVGFLEVEVRNANGRSDPFAVLRRSLDPALFLFDADNRRYVAAVHPDGALAGRENLFGGPGTRPVQAAGDLLLFGTGFGETNPATPLDRIVAQSALIRGSVVVRIGGVNAPVLFAGLIGSGLYQFNIRVPDLPPGDHIVEVFVDGVPVQYGVFLTVGVPSP